MMNVANGYIPCEVNYLKRVWLQTLLNKKNLRHSDVAEKSNISRAYFSQILAGNRRPSPEAAKRIAHTLGIESEWYRLLEQEGEEGAYGQHKEKQSPALSPIETKAYSS